MSVVRQITTRPGTAPTSWCLQIDSKLSPPPANRRAPSDSVARPRANDAPNRISSGQFHCLGVGDTFAEDQAKAAEHHRGKRRGAGITLVSGRFRLGAPSPTQAISVIHSASRSTCQARGSPNDPDTVMKTPVNASRRWQSPCARRRFGK